MTMIAAYDTDNAPVHAKVAQGAFCALCYAILARAPVRHMTWVVMLAVVDAVTGEVSPMPVDTLKRFWPKFLAGKARDWVLQRVAGGQVLSDVLRRSPDEFRRRFDLMAVQRNLKALGTFGFQAASRGNPVYIQYIPRTLNYARANLARYERFAGLRDLLSEHLPELR